MNHESNNLPPSNDPLDALLRDSNDYVSDNGFTNRVLTSLPPRRNRSWLRLAVISGAVLLGAALAVWMLPSSGQLLAGMPKNWSAWGWQTAIALVPVLAVLAALAWGVVAVANEEE